jgi:hypothetical protein
MKVIHSVVFRVYMTLLWYENVQNECMSLMVVWVKQGITNVLMIAWFNQGVIKF